MQNKNEKSLLLHPKWKRIHPNDKNVKVYSSQVGLIVNSINVLIYKAYE